MSQSLKYRNCKHIPDGISLEMIYEQLFLIDNKLNFLLKSLGAVIE